MTSIETEKNNLRRYSYYYEYILHLPLSATLHLSFYVPLQRGEGKEGGTRDEVRKRDDATRPLTVDASDIEASSLRCTFM